MSPDSHSHGQSVHQRHGHGKSLDAEHIAGSTSPDRDISQVKDADALASSSAARDSGAVSPRSDSASNQDDAHVVIPSDGYSSIYSLYSPRRRNTILMAAAFTSILVPFCDTVYLPALAVSPCKALTFKSALCDVSEPAGKVAASLCLFLFDDTWP